MPKIFSTTYPSTLHQKKFEGALEARDFEKAAEILKSIPKGYNNAENIEYLSTMVEGYRVLFSSVLEENRSIHGLGSIKDLQDKLQTLLRFEELGDLGDLSKTLLALRRL